LSSSSSSKDRHGSVPSEHMGSFNQAFSFLKKSGSYSPPPPPPPPLPPPPPTTTTVGSAPPSQPPGINGLKAEYALFFFLHLSLLWICFNYGPSINQVGLFSFCYWFRVWINLGSFFN
jgi:hypothetical protein